MSGGRIVQTGGPELARKVEEEGYGHLNEETA
jgi:Fe-S cluster assembly ATPase SufC